MGDVARKYASDPNPHRVKSPLVGIVSVCCCCKQVLDSCKGQTRIALAGQDANAPVISHGLCPACYEEQLIAFRGI